MRQHKNESMDINAKSILTTAELSRITGYSVKYIYKLVCEQKIPFYKPPYGRRLFFLREEIDEWLLSIKGKTLASILNTMNER